jgi:hypothetical protein
MDELNRFKSEIDLTSYAASRGYRVDRRESSRSCVVMRHPTTDDKIIVSRGEHDRHWIYFSVRDARDHGTIVDFVQRRDGGSLGAVRRELAPWIGGERTAIAPESYVSAVARKVTDRAAVARAFEQARAVSNSRYLNLRAIRPEILGSERFAGTFREDRRRNVLFPHRDQAGLAGFESKNHGWTSYSAGGVRALWWSNMLPDDRQLVLVESAIDALSFHQAHGAPRARYASTAGTLSERQRGLIREALQASPPALTVVLAFDRDAAGDKLAEQVQALAKRSFTRACPPSGKDWNEYLQRRERGLLPAPRTKRERSPER